MSFKVSAGTSAGDSVKVGALDWNKITTMLNGSANVATVPMNSVWQWQDGKLKLRNPANTFNLTIRCPAILTDLDLSPPVLTASDTILCQNNIAVIKNKFISSADNVLSGIEVLPDVAKTGKIQAGPVPGGNSGQGMLYGFIDNPGLPVKNSDPTAGVYWRYSSGTTQDQNTGISCADVFLRREWEGHFKTKIRVPSATGTTSTRLYAGISTDISISPGDTPLALDDSGVIVGWRSGDANFQVFRNSGTNTSSQTAIVVDTGIAKTTAPRTIDINFTNDGDTLNVTIADPSTMPETVVWSDSYTTNLPQAGFGMAPSIILQNSGAVNRSLDFFYAYTIQNV